ELRRPGIHACLGAVHWRHRADRGSTGAQLSERAGARHAPGTDGDGAVLRDRAVAVARRDVRAARGGGAAYGGGGSVGAADGETGRGSSSPAAAARRAVL